MPSEEPAERFYQNIGFYPTPPTMSSPSTPTHHPRPLNPADVPVRTYIPYSNSTGNISNRNSHTLGSPGGPPVMFGHPRGPPPSGVMPPAHQLNNSMPSNLNNWSKNGQLPPTSGLFHRDLLRQEAKMLEMQDELRRREERAVMMMSKQGYNSGSPRGNSQLQQFYRPRGPAPAPKPPYQRSDVEPGRPPLPEEYRNQPYAASMADLPKGAFTYNGTVVNGGSSATSQQQTSNISNNNNNNAKGSLNPWEREAKEMENTRRKELESRFWRENQIRELEVTNSRSAGQEEQLRALKLEQEFQRRAEEMREDDGEEEEEVDERKVMVRRLQEDLERTRISNEQQAYSEDRARKVEEMRRKKLELEATQAAEERLVREAARRRVSYLYSNCPKYCFPHWLNSFGIASQKCCHVV